MISFAKFLLEGIPLNRAREFRNLAKQHQSDFKDRGRRVLLPDAFSAIDDYAFAVSTDRYERLMDEIQIQLKKFGYSLGQYLHERRINFLKNRCYKIVYGDLDEKNPTSIAKILNKLEDDTLYQAFITDGTRSEYALLKKDEAKGVKYQVLVSTLYLDVAGMSTDKKWTSCMSLGKHSYLDGSNAEYLDKDIAHGTIVAYLIRTPYTSIDKAIQGAIARIAIRPHFDVQNPGSLCYVAGPVYGAMVKEFKEIVIKFANSKNVSKMYKRNHDLYDDGSLDSDYEETSLDMLATEAYRIALHYPAKENIENLIKRLNEPDIEKHMVSFRSDRTSEEIIAVLHQLFDKVDFYFISEIVSSIAGILSTSRNFKSFAREIEEKKEEWKALLMENFSLMYTRDIYHARGYIYMFCALENLFPKEGIIDALIEDVADGYPSTSLEKVEQIINITYHYGFVDKERFKKTIIPLLIKQHGNFNIDRIFGDFLEG